MTYDPSAISVNDRKLPTLPKAKKKPPHNDIEPILKNYFRPTERDILLLRTLYDFEDEVKKEHSFRRLQSYITYNF